MPRLIWLAFGPYLDRFGDDQVAVALHVDLADEALDALLSDGLRQRGRENQGRKQNPFENHLRDPSI